MISPRRWRIVTLMGVGLAAAALTTARPAQAAPDFTDKMFRMAEDTADGRYRTLRFTTQDADGNVVGIAVTQWSTGNPFDPPFDFQQHTVERPVSGQIYLADAGNWAIKFSTDAPSLIEGARYFAALAYDADRDLWAMKGTYYVDTPIPGPHGQVRYLTSGPYFFTADEFRPFTPKCFQRGIASENPALSCSTC
jgi:hypothetical protein